MIEKHWIARSIDQQEVLALAATLALSPITAKVLWGRGVRNSVQARKWLSDSEDNGHDPFLLPDMKNALIGFMRLSVNKSGSVFMVITMSMEFPPRVCIFHFLERLELGQRSISRIVRKKGMG